MIEKALDVLWQKNSEGIYVTPFLWGGTGQGKTQRTKAWAKAKGLKRSGTGGSRWIC